MEVVIICHKQEISVESGTKEYIFPLQEYLLTILQFWGAKVTLQMSSDGTFQDDIFGELPYLIAHPQGGYPKFITRDNIPKFISECTTINSWMSGAQKKSVDYIEHHILDLNPSFRLFPSSEPENFKYFLAKFYRISSEFHDFSLHDSILQLLSNKISDCAWFYDESHLSSVDFLAYYWLKQQLIRGEMGIDEEHADNIKENYKNLFAFVKRMDNALRQANAKTELLKLAKPEQTFRLDQESIPAEAYHIEWRKLETIYINIEQFKQRDTVMLEGKIRHRRPDTYLKEERATRYKRLAFSVGACLLFFYWNLPKQEMPKSFQF